MGIFKKTLAIVLAALMLVSVFTVAAFAEDGPGAGDVAGGTTVVVRGTLPNMGWDSATDAANTMTEKSGVYSIAYDTVEAGTYQFKVVLVDAAGKETWIGTGADGNQNFAIEVSADSDLTITYNAGTQAVDFSGANVSAQSGLKVDKIQIMGTVPGASWSFDEAAVMTGENDVYTVTLKNVAAGEYQYKFAANGNWDANWGAEADKDEELSGNGVFNSQTNFTLYFTGDAKDVTFKLDLSNFDYSSKAGATYEVTFSDATVETTAPVEETTSAPVEETTEAQEGTTAPVQETTVPATPDEKETTVPATDPASVDEQETTVPASPDEKIVPGFYVVGSEEVCGAEWGWDTPWKYNAPMALSADGVTYYQVFENIKASAGNETDEGPDIYVFKVVYVDELGNITWHPGGMGNNTKVTVAEDGSTVFFQFKLLASRPTKEGTDPEAVIATVYGPNDEKPADFSKVPYPEKEEETTVAPTTVAPTTVAPTTVAPTQPTTKKATTTKKANTIKVKVAKKTVKVKNTVKKAKTYKISKFLKVTKAKGKVTYAKVKKGSKTAKFFKKIKIAKKTGKVTFKKGIKKGTYKLKIKVTAAGNKTYKKKSVSKVVKIKVK